MPFIDSELANLEPGVTATASLLVAFDDKSQEQMLYDLAARMVT